MKFVWDDIKRLKNIQIHSIDFHDAVEAFNYPMRTTIDHRFDYGEERWVGIGFMKGIFTVIVYTENDEKNVIRLISARKATKDEIKSFKKTIGY